VLQRAWERGLVERDVTPPDADILRLIFAPGFSTAEQVTNLRPRRGHGRGAQATSRRCAARSRCHSTEGQGTVIDIRLPLTLAIIDGFLVGVGPRASSCRSTSVVEVIEAGQPADHHGQRGCALRRAARPGAAGGQPAQLYALSRRRARALSASSWCSAGDVRYGVDGRHAARPAPDRHQAAGPMFRSLRGISGSSILGNGEVALIFDVPP
jgi:two-component system chemotaxis sensor kinase CheA